MAQYRKAIRTIARQMLRDKLEVDVDEDFKDDEFDLHINEVLLEISQRRSYKVRETLTSCYRTGAATSTSASHLVDATNAQFLSTDVGKTVYNSTDGTTAKVTTYNSASDLTLDTDIMASGESYELYNEDCTSPKELNISSITHLLEVEEVEYPTRQEPQSFVNFKIFGDILRMMDSNTPDDAEDVFLYCRKVHQVTASASTLKEDTEKILIDGVVAKAAEKWLNKFRDQIVPTSYRLYQVWAEVQKQTYKDGLNSISGSRAWEYR